MNESMNERIDWMNERQKIRIKWMKQMLEDRQKVASELEAVILCAVVLPLKENGVRLGFGLQLCTFAPAPHARCAWRRRRGSTLKLALSEGGNVLCRPFDSIPMGLDRVGLVPSYSSSTLRVGVAQDNCSSSGTQSAWRRRKDPTLKWSLSEGSGISAILRVGVAQ